MASDSWVLRKQRELNWIADQAGQTEAPRPTTPSGFEGAKRRLRRDLLARGVRDLGIASETARTLAEREVLLFGFKFEYRYQRFDLKISGPPVYPGLHRGVSLHSTTYMGCGMSAISAVLLAIERILPGCAIVAPSDIYYETRHLLNHVCQQLKPLYIEGKTELRQEVDRLGAHEPRVLFLDSSTAKDPCAWLHEAAHFDAVFVDTTCWLPDGPRVKAIVDICFNMRRPLALLRSHIKLDSLGIEYGRLGSVVLTCPHRAHSQHLALASNLRSATEDLNRVLGLAPDPLRFGPFHGRVFAQLRREQIAHLKRHCTVVSEVLTPQASALGLATYHHGLFVTLVCPAADSEDGALDLATKLAVDLDQVLPTRVASSFGFDTMTLFCYRNEAADTWGLRISPGDLPYEGVFRWAKAFATRVAAQPILG